MDSLITRIALLGLLFFYSGAAAMVQPVDMAFLALLQRENSYRNTVAEVRTDGLLSPEEQQFLDVRLPVVKKSAQKIVGRSIKDTQIPRIAVVGSGGGYRAMISLTGFLVGLQEAGLLDLVSYVGGVSGSTWAALPWAASGRSIKDFQDQLFPTLNLGLIGVAQSQDINGVVLSLMKKWLFKQCINLVDIYGAVLANNLLLDHHQNASLHRTIVPRLADGLFPLPIGCALGGDNKKAYRWFEFSPFEVGSVELNAYVPTWGFGRAFKQGRSVDFAPEQNLGYMLGIFGSAFAESDSKDLLKLLVDRLLEKKQVLLSKIVASLANDLANNKDIGGGIVNNFMYELPQHPLRGPSELMFIDGGITDDEAADVGGNISLLPFLRKDRAIDAIIVVDASESFENAVELRRAMEYAQKVGFKVPEGDYVMASQRSMSSFGDISDGTTPFIIYMPNIKNEEYSTTFDPRLCVQQGYCSFLNFVYTPAQAYELSGLVSSNVKKNKNNFYQIVRDIVSRKARQ